MSYNQCIHKLDSISLSTQNVMLELKKYSNLLLNQFLDGTDNIYTCMCIYAGTYIHICMLYVYNVQYIYIFVCICA